MPNYAFELGYSSLAYAAPAPQSFGVTHATHHVRRGTKTYSGTLKRGGVPEVGKVLLLDEVGLTVLDETVSAPDGTWTMPNKWDANKKCIELALDKSNVHNAAVKANQ